VEDPSREASADRASLLLARKSGIRDCKRACLQMGIAARLERNTATTSKNEAFAKECDAKIRAAFALHQRLSEVEAWAWNSDTMEVACAHEKREVLGERTFCVECGSIL
jgi:hypothetical protein